MRWWLIESSLKVFQCLFLGRKERFVIRADGESTSITNKKELFFQEKAF